ncbi:MAG: hypothetical protein NTW87_33570 [Planctomycetota bacterium]|nr:hypothetical protein [Planctomycetota bacterium]
MNYLLNPTHRYGASKARFFGAFGFRAVDWEQFARSLREHGQRHPVARTRQTPFGSQFEVESQLAAPDGRTPCVRTVWQLDRGADAPRLIIAYPLEDEQ